MKTLQIIFMFIHIFLFIILPQAFSYSLVFSCRNIKNFRNYQSLISFKLFAPLKKSNLKSPIPDFFGHLGAAETTCEHNADYRLLLYVDMAGVLANSY